MPDIAFVILATGAALSGFGLLIERAIRAYAELRRAEHEGSVRRIRAERGDPEPSIVLHIDRPLG